MSHAPMVPLLPSGPGGVRRGHRRMGPDHRHKAPKQGAFPLRKRYAPFMDREPTPSSPEILQGEKYTTRVLRVPRKRGMSLSVKPDGTICLCASISAREEALRVFVARNEEWIGRQLRKYEGLKSRFPPKTYAQNEVFPLMGEVLKLSFFPREDSGRGRILRLGQDLRVEIPVEKWQPSFLTEPQPWLAPHVKHFYKKKAEEVLPVYFSKWVDRTGFQPKKLILRSQKTLWGSCSGRGVISLNWRLVAAPIEALEYVIIHELCHLRHPDHSERFWNLVGTFVPTFKTHRSWLNSNQFAFDFLSKQSDLYHSKV